MLGSKSRLNREEDIEGIIELTDVLFLNILK